MVKLLQAVKGLLAVLIFAGQSVDWAFADQNNGDPPAWEFNVPVQMTHLFLGGGSAPREDNNRVDKIFVLCEVGRGIPLPGFEDIGNNNRIYFSGWSGTPLLNSSNLENIDPDEFNNRALLGTGRTEIEVVNGAVDTTSTVQVWPLNPDVQPAEATHYACHFRLGVNHYRHVGSGRFVRGIIESGPNRNTWLSTANLRGAPFNPEVSGRIPNQ